MFRGLLAAKAPEAGSGCLSGKDAHPKRDQKQFRVVLPKPRPGAQPGEKATSVADATARHTLLVTPWLRTCLSAPAPCCWLQRGYRFCPRDPTFTPAAPGASSRDRASSFPILSLLMRVWTGGFGRRSPAHLPAPWLQRGEKESSGFSPRRHRARGTGSSPNIRG